MALKHRSRGLTSAGFLALATLSSPTATGQQFDASSYTRNNTIHEDTVIYWTVDTESETVRVAVHAKAASGWAGFGFSEMGGMEGSDIVYYEAASDNLTDAHGLEIGAPVVDECSQDWALVSAEVGSFGLVFEAERAFETMDPQDRVLVDDSEGGERPTSIIAAWGNEEVVTYHATNVGTVQVIFFGDISAASTDPLLDIKTMEEIKYFDIVPTNFTVPAEKTYYEWQCIPASEMPEAEEVKDNGTPAGREFFVNEFYPTTFHVVGLDAELNNGSAHFVHHLVIKGFTNSDDCGGVCSELFFGQEDVEVNETDCSDFTYQDWYGWAPGVAPLAMPDDVGFLFGPNGYRSVGIQLHYDNPNLIEGVQDDSGVRVYYTEELRAMDAGLVQLGDPSVLLAKPEYGYNTLPDGKSAYSFTCPSSCSEQYFQDESVTIIGHFLHMHATGQHMYVQQFRDDVVIDTVKVEYYSFDQGGGFSTFTNGSETIKRGDRFETHCFFDTTYGEFPGETVRFGPRSEDEMCIDFLYYYPIQPFPSGYCGFGFCNGTLDSVTALAADSTMNRTYGIVQDTCPEDTDASLPSSAAFTGYGPVAYVATASLILLLL